MNVNKIIIAILLLFLLVFTSQLWSTSDFDKEAVLDTETDLSVSVSNTLKKDVYSVYEELNRGYITDLSTNSLFNLPFINQEVFGYIKEEYDKVDFYSDFAKGEQEKDSTFKEKFRLLLKNEIPFINHRTDDEFYLNEYLFIRDDDIVKKYKYYYFDVDEDGVPELCISSVNFIYIFRYDPDLDQIILWCDEMGATWYNVNGSKTISWNREGISHGFYKLNDIGEIILTLFHFSEEDFNRETQKVEVVYMVALPRYAGENEEMEIAESMKQVGYFDEGQKIYYFRVTEDQYDSLTGDYFRAEELARRNLKEVTYTYDELFGS